MTLDLPFLWYAVFIIAMIAYTILDGFDLGVGALHLFSKSDRDRRIFINAIGPVWDGNEVWLVIVIGALFAGFPKAYATALSAFYNLVMVLLAALMFRACAIEFRSKVESSFWRHTWDVVFSISSVLIAFGMGVFLGNLVQGIRIDLQGEFLGSVSDFWNPYAILLGLVSLSLFVMHGAIYLRMKTEGEIHKRLGRWANKSIIIFFISYVALTIGTFQMQPHMIETMMKEPFWMVIPVGSLVAMMGIPYFIQKKRDGFAFLSSCFSIALLMMLFAIGTYPKIIRSSLAPEENSITIFNGASSSLTLKVLLIIVAIGVPAVIGYGFYIYRVFRGKVRLDETSY